MKERIPKSLQSRVSTAEQAALSIKSSMTLAMGGYAMAGYPKAIPGELARRANEGESLSFHVITGANLPALDELLAGANLAARRTPMIASKALAAGVNSGRVQYVEQQMCKMPRLLRGGRFGSIDVAIIEALAIDDEGIVPTTSVGMNQHLLDAAREVIVEINLDQPDALFGLHDVYTCAPPPGTLPIPLTSAGERIGGGYLSVPHEKLTHIVESRMPERIEDPAVSNPLYDGIVAHLFNFLELEYRSAAGKAFLPPIQTGFGGVANSIAAALRTSNFDNLQFFCGGIGESIVQLALAGKASVLSAGGIGMTDAVEQALRTDSKLRDMLILRSGDISNSAEVIGRLGLLALNTGVELDIYGNVNSSHIAGTRVVNGIGGGANFAQNAGLSVVLIPSVGKAGNISNIVPMVSHQDISEHDVDVIVTECGVADLRGLSDTERAEAIIANCACGAYKAQLRDYFERAKRVSRGHHPQFPAEAFQWYDRLKSTGSMLEVSDANNSAL